MKVSEHLSALGILAFAGGASSFLSAPMHRYLPQWHNKQQTLQHLRERHRMIPLLLKDMGMNQV
jgi:hypothetical protein